MKALKLTDTELTTILCLIQDELESKHYDYFNQTYKDSLKTSMGKIFSILSNEREMLGKHECTKKINCSHKETRKVDGYITECYKCGTIIINMND